MSASLFTIGTADPNLLDPCRAPALPASSKEGPFQSRRKPSKGRRPLPVRALPAGLDSGSLPVLAGGLVTGRST